MEFSLKFQKVGLSFKFQNVEFSIKSQKVEFSRCRWGEVGHVDVDGKQNLKGQKSAEKDWVGLVGSPEIWKSHIWALKCENPTYMNPEIWKSTSDTGGYSLREAYLTFEEEAQQRAKYKRWYPSFTKISSSRIFFTHV